VAERWDRGPLRRREPQTAGLTAPSSVGIGRTDEVLAQAAKGGLFLEWARTSSRQVPSEVDLLTGCTTECLEILLDPLARPLIEMIGGGEESADAQHEVLSMFLDRRLVSAEEVAVHRRMSPDRDHPAAVTPVEAHDAIPSLRAEEWRPARPALKRLDRAAVAELQIRVEVKARPAPLRFNIDLAATALLVRTPPEALDHKSSMNGKTDRADRGSPDALFRYRLDSVRGGQLNFQ
jgi:hypothetical protein